MKPPLCQAVNEALWVSFAANPCYLHWGELEHDGKKPWILDHIPASCYLHQNSDIQSIKR